MAGSRLSVRDEIKPLVLICAIAAGVAINRTASGWFVHFDWLVRVGLFAVVFTIMAFVEVDHVGRAFRNVKPTVLAVITNFIVVPAFAWGLGWVFLRGHPDLWAGVLLYTFTPCIGWYLIFIDLAEGDVPWGLAMLPIDITLQVLLLPFYLWLLVGRAIPVGVGSVVQSVALFLIAPFAAAQLVRRLLLRLRGEDWTYGPYRRMISESKLWAFVVVVVAIFATQGRLEYVALGRVGLIVATIIAFFLGLFVIALGVGRAFRLGYPTTASLVFEVTARNSEAVIGVAAVAFAGRPLVILAILIGPMIELPVLVALTRVLLWLRSRWTWPETGTLFESVLET